MAIKPVNSTDEAQQSIESHPPLSQNTTASTGSNPKVIAYVLFAIIATLATWALGLIDLDGEETIPVGFSNDFPGDLENWGRKGDWESMAFSQDAIFIQRKNEQQSVAFRTFQLSNIKNIHQYRLQVEGTIEDQTIDIGVDIEPFENPMGALMVWIHGADEEILQYRTIHDIDPVIAKHEASRSISVPEETTAISLVLATRGSTTGMMLMDAKMLLVKEGSSSLYVKGFLGFLWLLLLLLALFWIVKKTSLIFATSVMIICVAIGVGIVLPESLSARLILPLQAKLSSFGAEFETNLMEPIFKSGHLFFFLIASFMLFLKRKSLGFSALLLLVLLLTLAIASEGIQLQLYDRTTRLSDLLIDLSGVAVGALIASLYRLWKPETLCKLPSPTHVPNTQ